MTGLGLVGEMRQSEQSRGKVKLKIKVPRRRHKEHKSQVCVCVRHWDTISHPPKGVEKQT